MDAISGDDPFIMMADGRAWLYSPSGLLDGPMPTHYEPLESPVDNLLYPKVGANPAALRWDRDENPLDPAARPALPAHRLDLPAHGAPHRRPDEPQPAVAGRAAARDVRRDRPGARGRARDRGRRVDGDRDRARRDRGAREGDAPRAAAADRRPHDPPDLPAVALGHFTTNSQGVTGDTANDLVALSGDPNVSIEDKTFAARCAPGRRERGVDGAPRGRGTGRSLGVMTEIAIHKRDAQRMGFFTDTTTCIGCKACEVACKQWNDLPADGSESARAAPTTTPARSARRRGATCASSRPRRPATCPTSRPLARTRRRRRGRRRLSLVDAAATGRRR